MLLLRDYHDLPKQLRGAAVAIGNFDGLHPGHDYVLRQLKAYSQQHQCPCIVMSFEPPPQRFFRPDAPASRLMRPADKLRMLRETYAPDVCLLQRFDHAFAQLEADAFMQQVLIDGLGVAHVMTGEEFCFGKGRKGNVTTLHAFAKAAGAFSCDSITLQGDGEKFSSSRIREAVAQGDMQQAALVLGRPYIWTRRVVHGNKRGVGAATANLLPPARSLVPRYGVYAVRATTQAGEHYDGVANFGVQPSFAQRQERLEVHLFDFDGDLYGTRLTVEWIAFLREEQHFDDVEALRSQIMQDCAQAKEVLREH